jgi:hypothetical protein
MSLLDSSASDPEPVFVDSRRWRRPTLRWLGIIVAVMLAVYLWVVGLAVLSTVTVPPARPSQTVSDSSAGQEEPPNPWPRRATRP